MGVHSIVQLDLLTDLKNYDISAWVSSSLQSGVLLCDINTVGDAKGGFYRWDSASSAAEDTQFYNVIVSLATSTGRWVRVFQKASSVPQGVLVTAGGVKTLFVQTTTNSSGEAVINLTTDNTTTGPSIFTEVWRNVSSFTGDAPNISSAVQSYVKVSAATTSLKTTTHGYYKVQAINILLGGVISPITSVGSGVPVVFEVTGV